MKRMISLILTALLACLLAACGDQDYVPSQTTGAAGSPSSQIEAQETSAPETPPPEQSSSSQVAMCIDGVEIMFPADAHQDMVKLLDVNGGVLTAQGEKCELVTFAVPDSVEFANHDLEPELRPGQTALIAYDGTILETYPGQITVDRLWIIGDDGGLMEMIFQVLAELWGEDSGLNDGSQYFGFDLTSLPNLSSREQEAIGWVFASSQGREALFGSIQELGDEGYIDMENLMWEDGVHFELKASDVTEDSFSLDCTKWRSGLGAIGYRLSMEKKEGRWTSGEPEEFWIS